MRLLNAEIYKCWRFLGMDYFDRGKQNSDLLNLISVLLDVYINPGII